MRIGSMTYFLFIGISLWCCSQALGATGALSEPELILLDKINQARVQPLATAASLGIPSDQVLSDLPQLGSYLTQGFPVLNFSPDLQMAAQIHTEEMLAGNYYGYRFADGSTAEQKLGRLGYFSSALGEGLGLLVFVNFMESAQSAEQIFENLFQDELNPLRSEQRNILNPAFTEIGVGFGSGTMTIDNLPYNVHVLTCYFGNRDLPEIELQFLELVNQARENPLLMAQNLGIDTSPLTENPHTPPWLIHGMPPLVFNGILYQTARAHAVDMLANDYYSHISLDGKTEYGRMSQNGYEPVVAEEVMRWLSATDPVPPKEALLTHFQRLLEKELMMTATGGELKLLNPYFKEAAFYYLTSSPQRVQDASYDRYYNYLLVGDLGVSENKGSCLKGSVYGDTNQNGLYDFGEGREKVLVAMHDGQEALYTFSGVGGGFMVRSLSPGDYWVTAYLDEGPLTQTVHIGESNTSIVFRSHYPGDSQP